MNGGKTVDVIATFVAGTSFASAGIRRFMGRMTDPNRVYDPTNSSSLRTFFLMSSISSWFPCLRSRSTLRTVS